MPKEIYYSLNETSEAAGVSRNVLLYHAHLGNIPTPTTWSGRRVFNEAAHNAAILFMRSRKLYQRKHAKDKSQISES